MPRRQCKSNCVSQERIHVHAPVWAPSPLPFLESHPPRRWRVRRGRAGRCRGRRRSACRRRAPCRSLSGRRRSERGKRGGRHDDRARAQRRCRRSRRVRGCRATPGRGCGARLLLPSAPAIGHCLLRALTLCAPWRFARRRLCCRGHASPGVRHRRRQVHRRRYGDTGRSHDRRRIGRSAPLACNRGGNRGDDAGKRNLLLHVQWKI